MNGTELERMQIILQTNAQQLEHLNQEQMLDHASMTTKSTCSVVMVVQVMNVEPTMTFTALILKQRLGRSLFQQIVHLMEEEALVFLQVTI
jgi:hypothetical protein